MELFGGERDKDHVKDWLTANQRFPGLKIESVDKTLRSDIKEHMDRLVGINPGAIFVYMQGHGVDSNNGSYITGDDFDPKEGHLRVKSEELINMFSDLDHNTLSVAVTDFCYSGNFFRLRYRLELGEGGSKPEWAETQDWLQDSGTESSQLTCLMVHFAGSARSEQVVETERTGGYFTNVLCEAGVKELPELLTNLRAGVDKHFENARRHPQCSFSTKATQTPQVYCSSKLTTQTSLTKFISKRLPLPFESCISELNVLR